METPDIERGVDYLISRGLVDPEQIGAMGWSNGSILSIQLTITNPDRYKAAVVGAGRRGMDQRLGQRGFRRIV